MIARLRGERDELRQTEERLCLERGIAHEDHDRAIRERDEARREAEACRADLGVEVA